MEREPFGLLVPAYVHPPEGWDVLLAAGRKLPGGLITVANPSSGPGVQREQAYVDVIKALHARCTSVIGYVHDSHGERAPTLVLADIAKWFSLYDEVCIEINFQFFIKLSFPGSNYNNAVASPCSPNGGC